MLSSTSRDWQGAQFAAIFERNIGVNERNRPLRFAPSLPKAERKHVCPLCTPTLGDAMSGSGSAHAGIKRRCLSWMFDGIQPIQVRGFPIPAAGLFLIQPTVRFDVNRWLCIAALVMPSIFRIFPFWYSLGVIEDREVDESCPWPLGGDRARFAPSARLNDPERYASF